MQKLLIAESNDELRQALAELLGEEYQICVCRSGDRALELLRGIEPDIVYIDLMLPQLDGIAVLHTALQEGLHPDILVSLSFESPYITEALNRLQVDYMVKKPCTAGAIASHIREISGLSQIRTPTQPQPSVELSDFLLHLGLGGHRDGYHFLVYGTPLFAANPQQTVTKELYPAIGKHFGKSGLQVERSMRSAIHSAWAQRDDRIWREYFSPAPDGTIPRPTNSQMLFTLIRLLGAEKKLQKIG